MATGWKTTTALISIEISKSYFRALTPFVIDVLLPCCHHFPARVINKAQLGRSVDVSEVTIRDYLEIADKTFFWRTLPSYETTKNKSTVKMPKGIIRDSGINHYLAGIDTRDKLLCAAGRA